MRTMESLTKNGKILRSGYSLLRGTGRGIRMAADTGYKAGYFMGKHPEIEQAKLRIFKNQKAIVLGILGLILGIAAITMTKKT